MEGYVRNTSRIWRHALKRSIAPGQKIELDMLFAEYGERYDIEEGKPFVKWLRSVKLKDASTWEIYYKDKQEDDVSVNDSVENINEVDSNIINVPKDSNNSFIDENKDVMDIVNLSVRKAKEKLGHISNIKLLKNALSISRTQAGKDTLTIMLRKRIKELEVASRR